MLGTVLKFVSSPGGTLAAYAVAGLLAVGTLGLMYKLHNDGIRREALANYNKTQLEETVKNQKETIDLMKRIETLSNETSAALIKQREEIDLKMSEIKDYLDTPEAKTSDRGASKVIENTLRKLGASE